MLAPVALVAATLASQAAAFLIPPQIHDAAGAAEGQWDRLISHVAYTYELECPGCPFAGADENDPVWEQDVENKLLFTLNVDDDQRLNINEVPVYPLPLSHTVVPLTIVAQQIRVADRVASAPIPLGHALEIYPEDWDTEEPDKKLVVTKFTILDLNGIPVKVDTVKISLLQTEAKDEIMRTVVKIETIPFNETPGADTCQGQAKWSLCRLRAIILARVSQLVAAAKAHAKAAHKWMKPAGCRGRKFGKHGKPGHHGHHGPHGHHGLHRAMHRFGHMMHQAIRFFIIPALLGVIGGLMASAIGMLVGQFIVYMWFRFRRRGERGPVRHGEVVLVEEEKDELLAEEGELPPAYEDADIPNEAVEKH